MVPIKITYSLARDFPLAFAQLQATGSCVFRTSDAALQAAYPGCFGFRVVAATPRIVRGHAGAPIRGLLANGGVSQISTTDGTLRLSVRPPDGLPVSDFDISSFDMNVFGMPGATLMQFEGSGIETVWQYLLPAAANPGGLPSGGRVTYLRPARAVFGCPFRGRDWRSPGSDEQDAAHFGARVDRAGLLALLDKTISSAEIKFDLVALGLPAAERKCTVGNLFLVLVGASATPSIAAKLSVGLPAKTMAISLAGGVAFSNAPPITDALSTSPKSPLNALAGSNAAQAFTLAIDKTVNAGVDFAQIVDVLLGIDYTATF